MATPTTLALTGGTGFIGSSLLPRATAAGWRVRALLRPRRGRAPPAHPSVEWVLGDVEDAEALRRLLEGVDAVVHCAGAVRGAGREDFERVNALATGRLAELAARRPVPPRFLLVSSLAAREPGLSHYAASKWRGECALRAVYPDRRWAVLRPPAVYGPGDRELDPLFRCIARGFLPVPAGASGRFSLLYVDDLAEAVVRWLAADAGFGQAFEPDDGRVGGYAWDAVIGIGKRVLRGGRPVRRIPVPMPVLGVAAQANLAAARLLGYAPMLTPGKVRELRHADWLCDREPLVQATGWQPAVGLEEGLARTYGTPRGR